MNKKLGHDAIYDARELGIPRMLLLGLQHLFAMFGATVLVPILVTGYGLPLSIQTTLLFAGIGTLLFHVCTKFKVPAFLGSSFAFLGGFQAVADLNTGKFAAMTGEEKLPYALGGVVIAGLLYLVLALLFKLVVEHNMTNHLLGGDIDMTRDEYNKMRGNSVREVAGTHGNISFRDVLLFHQEE